MKNYALQLSLQMKYQDKNGNNRRLQYLYKNDVS